ncbi:MAG: hypothetical protein Q9220_004333 [cf. Caloplaca sp. 1 TL-2023]
MAASKRQLHVFGACLAALILGLLLAYNLSILHLSPEYVKHYVKHGRSSQLLQTSNRSVFAGNPNIAVPFGRPDLTSHGRSTFRAVKRAPSVLTFNTAVCKGNLLWQQVQRAFDGQVPAGRDFGSKDFSNGWTLQTLAGSLPPGWDDAFKSIGNGRPPNSNDIYNFNVVQDKDFLNSRGRMVPDATGGRFNILSIPNYNAILVKDAHSPQNRLQLASRTDISNNVPPLNRLSDMSLYLYRFSTGSPEVLRYIGHHFISNADTQNIIDTLFTAGTGRPNPNLGWPGLVFDMNSDGGKALLGTPNGLGVGWLLNDHAATLGRRNPRVHIWNTTLGRCMLWDLGPRA